MIRRFLRLGAVVLSLTSALFGAAWAQNALVPQRMITKMSLVDIKEVLAEMSISTQTFSPNGEGTLIRAELPNGNAFIIDPHGCADQVTLTDCQLLSMVVGFEPFPVSYDRMNDFHLTKSLLATTMRVGPNQGIVNGKIVLAGGVSKDTVVLALARFLNDVQNFYTGYVANGGPGMSVGLDESFPPLFSRREGFANRAVSYGRVIDLTAPAIGREEVMFAGPKVRELIDGARLER